MGVRYVCQALGWGKLRKGLGREDLIWMLIWDWVNRVLGGRDMCILFVRRIRNISNARDERKGRWGGGKGEGSYGIRGSCRRRQLWDFIASGGML